VNGSRSSLGPRLSPKAAQESEVTFFWIRSWEIGLPPCLISVVLLANYPLSEERTYEIKTLLARKKARTSSIAGLEATI
jgi:hypothetical protein